jgi:hypothetical protein
LDYVKRDRDVVLVGCTLDLWKPQGVRKLEWGGNGKVSLRATWDQGGREHTTQEEGFQVSKRDSRERGNWQGELTEGISKGNNEGLRHDLVLLIYLCVS